MKNFIKDLFSESFEFFLFILGDILLFACLIFLVFKCVVPAETKQEIMNKWEATKQVEEIYNEK